MFCELTPSLVPPAHAVVYYIKTEIPLAAWGDSPVRKEPLPWHNSAYAAMQAKRMIKIIDSTAVRGLISFTLPVHSFSRV